MPQAKNIQYLNKDFDTLKQKLIEFAEIYYPSTYYISHYNLPSSLNLSIIPEKSGTASIDT